MGFFDWLFSGRKYTKRAEKYWKDNYAHLETTPPGLHRDIRDVEQHEDLIVDKPTLPKKEEKKPEMIKHDFRVEATAPKRPRPTTTPEKKTTRKKKLVKRKAILKTPQRPKVIKPVGMFLPDFPTYVRRRFAD